MSDFTNFQLSELMLDMMCAESAIFVLISARGDIITQTPAAQKVLKQPNLRSIFEILSASASNSVKTTLKTGESIQTIEAIDSNIYRLDIRACKQGALLYFMPTENLFQGLPAHTKYELSTALSHNFMALNLMKTRKTLDLNLLNSIEKNSFRIQREITHLQMLENNPDLNISMNPTLNDLVAICVDILDKCKMISFSIDFIIESPKELVAVFDKKLMSHAVLNLLSNAMLAQNVTEIKLSLYKKEDMIYIDVYDNGVGIAEECIDNIGSEYCFHQDMDSFRYDKSYGIASGFGLSVVKRIANVHSGVFKAFANEGNGSTMQIIFPDNIIPNLRMEQMLEIDGINIIETELSVI